MKLTLIPMVLLSLAGAAVTPAAQESSADGLLWCGLDYSMVKMIGTGDFRQPDEIFPNMLEAWNGLFIKEMLPQLEALARPLRTDLNAVSTRNAKATPKQIEREDGSSDEKVKPSHITETEIAQAVRSYELKSDKGLGLVFIMDRLVKAQETGCLYVVFFELGSRKVVLSQRICAEAGGIGFRNYWFRPIKTAVKKLPKMYKTAIAKKT